MNKQNLKDSDLLANLPISAFLRPHLLILCSFLVAMATMCFFKSNWFGMGVDIILIVILVGLPCWRYRMSRRLVELVNKLQGISSSMQTLEEEGNSIILTFVRPSDELMDRLKKQIKKMNLDEFR